MESNKLHGNPSPEVLAMSSNAFYQNTNDDEIDLAELWAAIWSGKILILVTTFIFAVSSVIYAINQPNIYRASTLLAPASEQGGAGGLAKMAGQFGGLASLAGINLDAGGLDKTGLALEVLQSRKFIENFIDKYQLLLPLMAVNQWDLHTNTLIYDADVYDVNIEQWVREVDLPYKPKPSPWEAFEAFKDIMSISKDKDTGMIIITIEYYSPEVAKQWLLWLVDDINATMREEDKAEAQSSINFLSDKLQETQLADMQTVFYQLIEEQTKTIMLAEVSKEYVLKTIDPANAADDKVKPKRGLIVALGTLLGAFFSTLVVVIRYFASKS